jgi:ABC-type transport system involved in multi-copper enzyme maturation permease subunit
MTHPVTGDGTALERARDLLAAEWLKLRTVRSSYLTVLAAAGLALFVAIGLARANVSGTVPHVGVGNLTDAVSDTFKGFGVAQLIMAVFGALTVTAEYGSGLIRTTLTARPQRAQVLAAKVAVAGAVGLVTGEITALACFWSTQAVFGPRRGGASLWAPHVLPAVVGGGFYLGVVTVLGVGIGALIRHTAGALTVIVAFLYLVPEVGNALPSAWKWDYASAFPSTAAQQITQVSVSPASHLLGAGPSYAVLAAYSVAIPVAAAWLMRRRDA